MTTIFNDLHQFTNYVQPIDLSFNQYLLLTEEPILIHTGNIEQAKVIIPKIKELLGDKKLKYVFASHFESDECGGLSLILESFPEVKTICSAITARQLIEFGITDNVIIQNGGTKLTGDDYDLEFITYPSEMHMWEGVLLFEKKRKIFFSSDLMFRFGDSHGKIIDGNWKDEVETISLEQIPNEGLKEKIKLELFKISPEFIAAGHGACVNI
ncbi:MAG: hypothetical protein KBF12_04680 [Sebaldella sp.]|nr:hypothetical protein [Sebaldella sp.]